jgi:subtilisin family serine protease
VRSSRRLRTSAAVTLAAALLLPTAALATPAPDGLWYVDALALDQAQQTATGSGITIAVIDTPIDPTIPELEGVDLTVHEPGFCDCDGDGTRDPATAQDPSASHGTSMTALILGNGRGNGRDAGIRGIAPGATVRHYSRGTAPSMDEANADEAVRQAIADGADIINMSFGGSAPPVGHPWRDALAEALRAGVVLVASGGNVEGLPGFPAAGNGIVTVSHFGPDGEMVDGENVAGPQVDVAAPGRDILAVAPGETGGYGRGNGSSASAAIVSGVLALAWSAHPEATGNQMIQALLRTTESSDGDLTRYDDWWGYGKVSLTRLLASDPTSYPDVNPLLVDGPDQVPTLEEVVGNPGTETTPDVAADGSDEDPGAADGRPAAEQPAEASLLPPVLLGVAALVVLGLVALGAVAARRSRAATVGAGDAVEERV